MAATLKDLPFPIDELSWDKLDEVKKHLKVRRAEAFHVMCHILGEPEGPLAASWLQLNKVC